MSPIEPFDWMLRGLSRASITTCTPCKQLLTAFEEAGVPTSSCCHAQRSSEKMRSVYDQPWLLATPSQIAELPLLLLCFVYCHCSAAQTFTCCQIAMPGVQNAYLCTCSCCFLRHLAQVLHSYFAGLHHQPVSGQRTAACPAALLRAALPDFQRLHGVAMLADVDQFR
jgi:hypothetical protein